MTTENGNGELRQLLEIKRGYRKDLEEYEDELTARYERELADAKKQFKEKYLEKIVDTVFAETPPVTVKVEATEATIAVKPEVKLDLKVSTPGICPECDAQVEADDKFCSRCACPLTESDEDEKPTVAITGRKWRTRVR